MNKLKYLPALLLSSSVLANGNIPAPMAVEQPKINSPWGFYAGFNGGVNFMKGHRELDQTPPVPSIDRVTNEHARANAGRVEGYFGFSWKVPNTNIKIGLEPNASYTNVKSNDFNTVLVDAGPPAIFNSLETKWSSKYSFGIDFRPSYNFNPANMIYALIGTEARNFKFTHRDRLFSAHKHGNVWGFNWGLGYEHRINDSSVGIRFHQTLFGAKKVRYDLGGADFNGKLKARFCSIMLTYKYNFVG